jgi:nucleotide-binding universal stress UspA family protein
VAHQEPERRRSIIVGVDGSPSSKDALRWAIRYARLVGASVEPVMAWQDLGMYGFGYGWAPVTFGGDHPATIAGKVLAESVAEVTAERGRPLEVRPRVTQGHAADVLLQAARAALLLVVGSRGHGTMTGMLLGSVSHQCVQHAPCPVVVVPPVLA